MESVTATATYAHLSIGLDFVSATEEPYMGKPYVRFCEGMLIPSVDGKDAFYSTNQLMATVGKMWDGDSLIT